MKEAFQLIRGALPRLISGRISPVLWLILVAGSFAPIMLDELTAAFDETGVDNFMAAPIALLAAFVAFALILFGFWRLERAAANYQDRTGDFFAWIGWGLLAYVPMISIGAIAMYRIHPDGDTAYYESLYMSLVAFGAPLLVHASGRAIDEHGPPMNAIWAFWSARYFTLVGAYLLATAPLLVAGDMIFLFSNAGRATVIVGEAIAALLYLTSSVIATALTVEAFHRAEQAQAA